MAVVTISQTSPVPPIQIEGTEIILRVWYTRDFIASDGVTPVVGWNGNGSGFYYEVECEVDDDGNLVIPAFDVQPTTGSNPTAGLIGQLYVDGAPGQIIFAPYSGGAGWQIPTVYGDTVTYDELARYNAAVFILNAPSSYFTADQTIAEILRLAAAGAENYAAVGTLGLVRMSAAPFVASEPTALSNSDPTVGDILGTLSDDSVPRASGSKTLENSQITDDGTNVGVQTLNYFQAGDYNDLQNGSYLDVNDTTGRANLFAGGGAGAQYAGVAALADDDTAQVFVQATNYSYLFGQEGVAVLGDGNSENNGTTITIDDVNELIKLSNVPTSDPAVAGAIWNSSGTLKISAG